MTKSEEHVVSSNHLDNETFYVSGWEVSPDTLQIKKDDKSVKFEPKVMQVLVFLAISPWRSNFSPRARRRGVARNNC